MEIFLILSPILLYLYLFYVYYNKIIDVYNKESIETEVFIKENIELVKKQPENHDDAIIKEYTDLFEVELEMLNNKVNELFNADRKFTKRILFIFILFLLPLLMLSEERINKRFFNHLMKKQSRIFYKKTNNRIITVDRDFDLCYLNSERVLHRNNKEALFSLFNMKKDFFYNGKMLTEKEFERFSLKEKINEF